MSAAATETELERTVREEQAQHDEQLKGEDAEKGKLFEMPKIEIDESNPTQITISFSGSVVLDRSQADDVALYNSLKPGKLFELQVGGLVKGPSTVHRRDSEGNIDAVAQTKSLVIDSITADD